jgi:hypothetical protein
LAGMNQAVLTGAIESGPKTAIEEKRFGDEIAEISHRVRASARRNKRRKKQ